MSLISGALVTLAEDCMIFIVLLLLASEMESELTIETYIHNYTEHYSNENIDESKSGLLRSQILNPKTWADIIILGTALNIN